MATTPRSWLHLGVAGGGLAAIGNSTIYLLHLAAAGNQLMHALMHATAAIAIVAAILPRVPLDRP